MGLYQEIILLQQWHNGKYVIENVIPYYDPLIKPNTILHRHSIWCNFYIRPRKYPKMQTCKARAEREFLQKELGFNLDKYTGIDKRLLLRNCVLPQMGKDIFDDMLVSELHDEQEVLF